MGILSYGVVHRGVDFDYDTGTHVYAVAGGKVTDLREDCGDQECTWGNFVVIQHDQRQYDRVNDVYAYVYTMYIRLNEGSVQPATIGTHVNAGDWIGDVDRSGTQVGNSPHLHLQTVINPQPDLELELPDLTNELDSENRSRNPEIWLAPYNNPQNGKCAGEVVGPCGTVIGKKTDVNGDPVGNVSVTGLVKNSGWSYWGSYTYNHIAYTFLNPDDIFVENWATTDVTPGTYDVYIGGVLFAEHVVVEANRVTYVGLYPAWLPFVQNPSPWSSSIAIFNSSATHTANVNSTKFSSSGVFQEQRADDYVYPAYGNWVTSINVRNTGPEATTVTVDFMGYSCSATLNPRGMHSRRYSDLNA